MNQLPMAGDRELVQAIENREPGAFERLVAVHKNLCWHIIVRMVRDPEDARDLCQDTFVRVYQNLRQYRYESTLRTWIGRIAYSVAARHLERRRTADLTQREAIDEGAALRGEAENGLDTESAWTDEERRRRLRAAIDKLPALHRTLVTLYHLDELSIPEIGEITGLAAGTIKSHLFRTRLRLKEILGAGEGA